MAEAESTWYFFWNSRTGQHEDYSTLDGAREALRAWILTQRQAGEVVLETGTGQWHDSCVTRWIADRADNIVRLNPE